MAIHYHHSGFFSQSCLRSFKIPITKTTTKISPIAFNGHVPISLKNQRNFRESSQPITLVGPQSNFLQMGTHSTRRIAVKSMGSDSSTTSTALRSVFDVMHLVVSLGIILAMDKYLKLAFVAAAIKFPSALFGMFCIFTILVVLDSTLPAAATGLMNFFQPALMFIQRWLPLFYVPSLVVLPLAVQDIPAASGVKICFIIGKGLSLTTTSGRGEWNPQLPKRMEL